jgi:tetratricopeptide (TPR) repeat protein
MRRQPDRIRLMPSSDQPPIVSRRPWRTTVLVAGLALAVAAAYWNSLGVPFLLDDEANILENESLALLPDLRAVLFPRTDVFTAGRPLLNLSFALNHAWGGTNPLGYHVVNVAIHLLASFTLFGIVRRTLQLPRFDRRFLQNADGIAGAAALLWALHPLQTASVTYVSQRAESLMGLCYLFTLYALLRAAARPGGWTLVAMGACFAGMLVKEVMVTAPVMVFLFDVTFVAGSFGEAWRRRRHLHLGLAASWLALGALMASSRLADRGVGYEFALAWHEYLRIECGAILHYLGLAFFPHPLVFDYGEQVAVPPAGTVALQAGLLVLLIAGIIRALLRGQSLAFLGIWFLLILVPTSSIVPVAGQPVAENRVFLPVAAVCVLVSVAAVRGLGRRAMPPLLGAALALGGSTVQRNHTYRSELAIWEDTVARRPMSARAQCYYGNAVLKIGRLNEAASHLEKAIRIAPGYSHAHLNLGTAYLGQKRIEDALRHYGIALQLKPHDPVALNNLGTAYFHAGRINEALACYQEVVRLRPNHVESRLNYGLVLGRTGRLTEALAIFEDVVRQHPQNPLARELLQTTRVLLEKSPSIPAR